MITASLGLGANIQTQSKELRKTKGLNTINGNEAQVQIITNKGKQKGQKAQWGHLVTKTGTTLAKSWQHTGRGRP